MSSQTGIRVPLSKTWDSGIEHAARTDVGLRRTNNQDNYTIDEARDPETWRTRGHLFMVADGMGAHAAGELASKLAVDCVPLTYSKMVQGKQLPEAIRAAVEDANTKIHMRGQANIEFNRMGTTSSVLLLVPAGALVAHVGDSRVYRVRNRVMEQLTFDHSLVWEMAESGQIPTDQVHTYVPRNIITRSLGPNPQVQVDLEGPFPILPGDVYLLCSDGLTGVVKDEEIAVMLTCLSPQEAVNALVDLANLRGGPDNITVIVAKVAAYPSVADGRVQKATPANRPKAIRPIIILLFFMAVTAAVVLGLANNAIGALIAGGMAMLALLIGLLQRYGQSGPKEESNTSGYMGKGPYRSYESDSASLSFLESLASLVLQVKQAAQEEHWKVDWEKFNTFASKATAAVKNKQVPEAVREYCRAISFLMQKARSQEPPAATK